jgi:biopolymer transport protein ExbD/biopolymer transport protein TolR
MGMSTGGGDGEVNAEINVTPMVDIMLVLLIIFMVVTPLLSTGVPVNLPRDVNSADEDPYINNEKAVVVSIPNNNEFYVGKDKVATMELLGRKVNTLLEGQTPDKRIVYIRSGTSVETDEPVNYGTVVQAIEIIRQQDVDKIGLVADRKKGGGASSGGGSGQ